MGRDPRCPKGLVAILIAIPAAAERRRAWGAFAGLDQGQESGRAGRDVGHRMKRKQLPQNLLSEAWTDLDSDELRLLLGERFGPGLGQYDGDDGKVYLPLARAQSRIALTFDGNEIVAVEPGEAFNAAEWERVNQEIELGSHRDAQNRTRLQFQFISCAGIMARPSVRGSDPPGARWRSTRGGRR
jgi:hypothetical protein